MQKKSGVKPEEHIERQGKEKISNKVDSVVKDLKKGISKEALEKIKKAKEPTWVAITPWSDCTRKCDGGKSYLQRICIVPKNLESHCEGERIVTKECNLEPCDGNLLNINTKGNFTNFRNDTAAINKNVNEIKIINTPEIKFMPISERPLRYERCVMKEGDLAIYINDGYMKGSKIPARVLLNNRTLTVYSSDVNNYKLVEK